MSVSWEVSIPRLDDSAVAARAATARLGDNPAVAALLGGQTKLGLVSAPVTVVADQTGISGVADYTGFSITFTVAAGRFYEAQWHFLSSQVTATGTQTHSIVLDGVGIIIGSVVLAAGGINVNSGAMQFTGGPASGNVPVVATGSRIIKLRGLTSSGTMNISNAGSMNGRFSVKDIGPNPT